MAGKREKQAEERERIIQASQPRYGDYAWGLPDDAAVPDEIDAEADGLPKCDRNCSESTGDLGNGQMGK
jgi:hypothetical protein